MSQPNQRPVFVVTLKNRIVAMDAHSGQRVWEVETIDPQGHGAVQVEQDFVVHAFKDVATCVRYSDGHVLWRANLPRQFKLAPNVMIFAGCVLLANTGEVAALHLHTGQLLWHDGFDGYGIYGGAMAAPGVFTRLDRRT